MRRRENDGRRVDHGGAGVPTASGTTTTRAKGNSPDDVTSAPAPDPALSWAERIASWRELLPAADVDGLDDDERLTMLRELELLTRAVAAVGASLQVAFYTSQVAAQLADGVAPSRAGRAVPDDLAQARLTSPYWGSRELTCAKALVREMPHTLGALRSGVITALQARVITEATTCVDACDRAEIDDRLAARLAGASTQEIGALARSLVYEVDPAGFVARARKAAADRGVSIRPCPDVMGLLSARLPAAQAIACYHSLRLTAEAMKASGDPRTLGQLMADTLFERLTGRAVVDGVDVEVGLVITDEALFAGTSDAAVLLGYGPIPAQTARDLLNPSTETDLTDHAVRDDPARNASPQEGPSPDRDPEDHVQDDGDRDEHVQDAGDRDGPTQDAGDRDGPNQDAGGRDGPTQGVNDLGQAADVAGPCPDGRRCTSFSCTLTHGHPAAAGLPRPPELASLSRPALPDRSGAADDCVRQAAAPEQSTEPPSRPGQDPEARPRPDPLQQLRHVPAPDLVPAASVWVRRLYSDPVTGVLSERDSRKRLFTGSLRAFLVSRDQTCRNTWCGAPVRHVDHIQRHADHGLTDPDNGRGLCARCNLARERPRQLDTPPATYRPPPPLLPCLPRPQHHAA